MRPEVTIVIPLFNKGASIRRAIQSVLAQTYRDFELIVVNDGSTDGGEETVKELADSRIRLINQPNLGPGAARNNGVRESAGTYVAFLDADDELSPNFIQQNLGNLRQNPECALSTCGSCRGAEKTEWMLPVGIELRHGAWEMLSDCDLELVRWACFSIHISVLIKRETFLRLGGFFEERCVFGEDSYLWLQVLLNHPIYREPDPLLWYHTEDAELNLHYTQNGSAGRLGFFKKRPLLPFLSDPEGVRRNCPPDYRPLLERYLAFEAVSEALTRTTTGDAGTARELQEQFPLMKRFPYEYATLQLKLLCPFIVPFGGRVKRMWRTVSKRLLGRLADEPVLP